MSLGSYPLVSLLDARQARDNNKQMLKQGINPKQEKSLSNSLEIAVNVFDCRMQSPSVLYIISPLEILASSSNAIDIFLPLGVAEV